jgi:integrase/recombinase XerC
LRAKRPVHERHAPTVAETHALLRAIRNEGGYRMHEVNLQRAVKRARRRLGLSVPPHELRHAYATHCLDRGTNPRAIQEAMRHKSLETTMGYLHAESR